MKTMRALLLVLLPAVVMAQAGQPEFKGTDYLKKTIFKFYDASCVSYTVRSSASTTYAPEPDVMQGNVTLKQKDGKTEFLLIKPDNQQKNLLMYRDSVWEIDHTDRTKYFIDTSYRHLGNNGMAQLNFDMFRQPYSLKEKYRTFYLIDHFENSLLHYSMVFSDSSDIAVKAKSTVIIDTTELLFREVYMEAEPIPGIIVRRNMSMDHFVFGDCSSATLPDWFNTYKIKETGSSEEAEKTEPAGTVHYLDSLILTTLDGRPYVLPDDKPVFIDAWYVGCLPCMKSAPVIDKLYEEFKDRITFLSLNEVDKDVQKIKRFQERMQLKMEIVRGNPKYISRNLSQGGYPVFVIMEPKSNKVLYKNDGYYDGFGEVLRTELQKYCAP